MTTVRCLSCMQEIDAAVCPHCGYPEVTKNAPHHLPVGTVLRGRYQIGKVLGQGGFGITYLAWDTLMQTQVAVKEFFPTGTVYRKNAETLNVQCVTQDVVPHYNYSRERFLREANALVKFKNIPEIVDILDFVEEYNTGYIVMEFVRGVDMARYIQGKGGRLTVDETFRILKPVMKALAVVHEGGIVHRDISPDNIILDPMGGAKLLDFGAVRAVENPDVEKGLNKSTEAILKHGFAPIEQYNSRGSLGPWTDEYAMCATVWYCLTGQIPEEASIRVSEGIDPDWASIPGLPEHQQRALQKGFSCRAKDRYPSLYDLMEAMFPGEVFARSRKAPQQMPEPAAVPEDSRFQKTVSIPSGSGTEQTQPVRKKKNRLPLALGAAAAVAVIAAVVLAIIVFIPKGKYDAAVALRAEGKYEEAIAAFEALGDYSDSADQISLTYYAHAERLLGEMRYTEAIALYEKSQWQHYDERINVCYYEMARQLKNEQKYDEAAAIFASLGNYSDSATQVLDCHFCSAMTLDSQGRREEAITILETLGDYRDSDELARSYRYATGQEYLSAGDDWAAIRIFTELGDYMDAAQWAAGIRPRLARRDAVGGGYFTTVAIRSDGTCFSAGWNFPGRYQIMDWQDIVAVDGGFGFAIGLRSDGTVVAAGSETPGYTQASWWDVSGWHDIVDIASGFSFCVGLRSDGTLVSTELDPLMHVSGWRDIVDISVSDSSILGLRYDGTVVATGSNENGQCNVSDWENIVAVCACGNYNMGLRADGTVVFAGYYEQEYYDPSLWTNIVDITPHYGLRADGTVVTLGTAREHDSYWSHISHWTNIVDITYDANCLMGIRSDGTLLAVGDNAEGQCNITAAGSVLIP